MNKLNNVLVGIDFSDCSRSALEQAVRLAKWNDARLHTVHAIEYLTLSDTAWASQLPQERLEQDAVAEAQHNLHQWLKQSKAASETEVLVDVGSPIDCILRDPEPNLINHGSINAGKEPQAGSEEKYALWN